MLMEIIKRRFSGRPNCRSIIIVVFHKDISLIPQQKYFHLTFSDDPLIMHSI